MDCENKSTNMDTCTCTYSPCPRKGICCECLRYHLSSGELPGCVFPPKEEKTYNRSIDYFVSLYRK